MRTFNAVALAVISASCRAPASGTTIALGAGETRSNILRRDYVGSGACASCHAAEYAKWATSPIRQMTRDPDLAVMRAPFAGETFAFKEDSATLFRQGAARLVRLTSLDGEHLYRITRVIGNHYREDFAGVEVASSSDAVLRGFGPELILPVTYYYETRSYRPKGYSVMAHERPGLRAGGIWNRTCIFCHNTVPWIDSALGELAGQGAPTYQGVVVDRLLPPERRFGYRVERGAVFRAAVADEAAFVASDKPVVYPDDQSAARAAIRTLADRFEGRHLVEEGIGCEACHGGGREHSTNPQVRMSFAQRSDFLAVGPTSGTPSQAWLINRTCARCHQVLFSRYPYTWEGGLRYHGPLGGSSTTSGEARDFLLGGPGRSLACTACHDPHALDRPEALARLETPAGNAVCLGCHRSLASAEGLAEHTHHKVDGAGSACVACHMPRKNMALDYRLTRYHRIGSPTDRERVEGDRPLECALCHADKSVASLLGDMERFWGKKYDRHRLRELYGDLDANVLLATLARGRTHEQVVAAMTLAGQHDTAAIPGVAGLFASRYPLARRFADKALASLLDKPCDINVDEPLEQIRAAMGGCGIDTSALPPVGSESTAPRKSALAEPHEED